MQLAEVQTSLEKYVKSNSIGILLMQFSKILIFAYPIYILANKFSFLWFLTKIFGIISPLLYLGYMVGLIIGFAKNDMLSIGIAFGLKAVGYLISIIKYSLSWNSVLWIILYGALAIFVLQKSTMMRE